MLVTTKENHVKTGEPTITINAYGKTEKCLGLYALTWYANYDVDCDDKI